MRTSIFRQAVHGLGHQARAGATTRSRICELLFGEDFVARPHGADEPHQRQFAAGLGFDHARRGGDLARANQACIITPFILSGAMSPVTVAGTLTQVSPK